MTSIAGSAFVADKTNLLGVKACALSGSNPVDGGRPMIGNKPMIGSKPGTDTVA